ncbi:MAG TPA: HoxN/HupN/NixA family nickel/cobalt transporter [Micropepsaceae bacterium]|jgi:high-affinity nickel-transport protein|nr:HoxN/HupN/NixA family nickel/cobalt transporter [Micropepsaceae bacterium]
MAFVTRHISPKVAAIFVGLIAANLGAWIWAIAAFRHQPVLLGTALLAYSFGLRHAVDADHIAAIDNVTRKLMQTGKRADCVGLFFSLGHSTVVVLASLLIALGAGALSTRWAGFRDLGGVIGTSVSALFLFAIALANLFILGGVARNFRRVRRGGPLIEDDGGMLGACGVLARMFGPLFRFIRASWQMYPLGFLFGLGFDTATEIGVLGISAAEAAKGLSILPLLIFPALFTAGMALVDTADSVLMSHAYGWAFVKPIRKLYYNLTITAVSVLVALLVGSVEALGLMANKFALHGAFWDGVVALNSQFGTLGYLIIAVFVLSWIASLLIYRLKGYDRLELGAEI